MTEVNITPPAEADKQEHIDAMVAKAEAQGTPPATPAATPEGTPERPEWLPEKFATVEDMAAAYAEMEKKLGAPKDTDGEPTPAEAEAAEAAAKAVESAGLDMDALGEKIVKNGDLDAADYEALAKQGISKDMVQNYVSGQQAVADKMVAEMHETVGGEEAFTGLLEWGAENLSADEIASFNETIDTGKPAAVKLALQGLQARQQAQAGTPPNLLGGKRGAQNVGEVFRSTAEVTKAMGDPRYRTDPAYRADVMAKLGRSNVM